MDENQREEKTKGMEAGRGSLAGQKKTPKGRKRNLRGGKREEESDWSRLVHSLGIYSRQKEGLLKEGGDD